VQKITIDFARCTGCRKCFDYCPTDVFRFDDLRQLPVVAFEKDCCTCFLCEEECPTQCITVAEELSGRRRKSVYVAEVFDDALLAALAALAPPRRP
jgi:NAD-dependent dihydropyrimidine dehydrogenase PreA subunit